MYSLKGKVILLKVWLVFGTGPRALLHTMCSITSWSKAFEFRSVCPRNKDIQGQYLALRLWITIQPNSPPLSERYEINIKPDLTWWHVFSSCLHSVMWGRDCQTVHFLLSAQSSLSVGLLRRQGGAVRKSGMPRLFGKCQCAAPAITEAGFGYV